MVKHKTKFIGFKCDESLYNFLNYMVKEIAPKDPRNPKYMSELIRAILKRFWLEYMLGMTKTPVSELEKEFLKKYSKPKRKKKSK